MQTITENLLENSFDPKMPNSLSPTDKEHRAKTETLSKN